MHFYFQIIFCLILCFFNFQNKAMASQQNDAKKTAQTTQTLEKDKPSGAIFSDAQNLYRICNSRPQRLNPSFTSKYIRILFKENYAQKKYAFFHYSYPYNDKRSRIETAPFSCLAPSDYYVFALRRLIC